MKRGFSSFMDAEAIRLRAETALAETAPHLRGQISIGIFDGRYFHTNGGWCSEQTEDDRLILRRALQVAGAVVLCPLCAGKRFPWQPRPDGCMCPEDI